MQAIHRIFPVALLLAILLSVTHQKKINAQDSKNQHFQSQVAPLLKTFCFECHAEERAEGEINLEHWNSTADAIKDISSLQKLDSIVRSGQMPPKDERQLSNKEKQVLLDWSQQVLQTEAKKYAGDPGPVVLRRLSNAEYNYSIQDITGLPSLNPTRQFPVDGAAGEGFTNSGAALGMSPSLFQKYLDAGKEIAAHAMLLDQRIEFSMPTSRRDRADRLIARIQTIYDRYTTSKGGTPVNLQGIQFDTNTGGRLPIEKYIEATLQHREALLSGQHTLDAIATEQKLSPKYLRQLWQTLNQNGARQTFLIKYLQKRWRQASLRDAPQLAEEIQQWQNALWKFNTIGHIGRPGGAKSWMEKSNPHQITQEFRIPLTAKPNQDSVNVFLGSSHLLGSGPGHIRWIRPRLSGQDLSGTGNNEILLRDLNSLVERQETIRTQALAQTSQFLKAADEIEKELIKEKSLSVPKLIAETAARYQLNPKQLQTWLQYLGIRNGVAVSVTGHFQQKLKSSGGNYEFIQGWGTHDTPVISANSSDTQVRIPGIAKPHSVMVHPSPTLFAAVGWQSPLAGEYEVSAKIADHHPECGNGVEWRLVHRSSRKATLLWKGKIGQAKTAEWPATRIRIAKGDLIAFYVGPRKANHVCDLTQIDLNLRHIKNDKTWNLAKDLSPKILESNPHKDSYGNPDVWHLFKGNWSQTLQGLSPTRQIPANSELAKWIESKTSTDREKLAQQIQQWIDRPTQLDKPNSELLKQVKTLMDPYRSALLRNELPADPRFGKRPDKSKGEITDLFVPFNRAVRFRIPSQLAEGRHLIVSAVVESETATTPVQASVGFTEPVPEPLQSQSPILVPNPANTHQALLQGFDDFRALFPAALCYKKIVPIDEVVTLTLYHREDQFLKDLFLTKDEIQLLDRLWHDLIFVSREPLKKVVALEQIYQFATQDRPDLVKEFATLFEPTKKRADEFRKRLQMSEPYHLRETLRIAREAWRRPLTDVEIKRLMSFYQQLRQQDIDHEKAIQLTLSRIFVSPAFLYRRETSHPGTHYSPISNLELASRLSYFLWSSTPDAELRQLAQRQELTQPETLKKQANRMLRSDKSRRLAIHFACQWLHLRDFDTNNDKNEKLFPEFPNLRQEMYEETVLFFERMFRENRSVLEIIDADYLYANSTLAKHYGLAWDSSMNKGDPWARVEGVQKRGRGGVLGMASFLASQSGASRTSPILRGNWVSETLLGEKLPKPPKNIPQLPELIPEGLTARQLIEKHSADAACAKCHARIDPYGFALEQYDPLGRIRSQHVDTKTTLVDGESIEGMDGLKRYLLSKRKDDFLKQFCRKLLGYALGRETQLSDAPVIQKMISDLKANDYKVHTAIETILNSDPFLHVRDQNYKR